MEPPPATDVPPDEDCSDVERVLAGETEVFGRIVRRHHRRLYYFVVGKLADSTEAEDLVQKTFVTAYQSLLSYDQRRPLFEWLRGIALNHCRNAWRQRARQARLKDQLLEVRRAEWELAALPAGESPDENRLTALRACIESLAESERTLIQQRFIEELPLRTIGANLGRSEEAARQLLFRLRARLVECIRRRLAQQGDMT